MFNNFFLHSAVLNPLLLFVFCLMPYAVCTFVLYYFHMQLMCLPDLRSNLKFAERQDYVRQAIEALAGKSGTRYCGKIKRSVRKNIARVS